MSKMSVAKTKTPLQDLDKRIGLMIKINSNSLANGELSGEERIGLQYQNNGFIGIQVLIHQLIKRGAIWEGGYLDNVGVVYEDQLQSILDEQEAIKTGEGLDN